jgi:hypothetical protein
MRWIDRALSLLLILGGVGHTFGVIDFYKNKPDTLIWSLTDSVLIFLLAAINLLRSGRPFDRPLAVIATCGSIANLVIALEFGRLIGNMTDFRVLLFAIISLGLTAFGLRDVSRSGRAQAGH